MANTTTQRVLRVVPKPHGVPQDLDLEPHIWAFKEARAGWQEDLMGKETSCMLHHNCCILVLPICLQLQCYKANIHSETRVRDTL